MVRAFAAIAVATAAFHLLAVLHSASAARPMGGWQAAASSGTATSLLALAPAAGRQTHQRHPAAAAAWAGKWLPFAGVHHHLPVAAAYWAHRPVPWVGAGDLGGGAAAGAVEGGDGEGEEVVRERERRHKPSYEGDADGSTTRQEQLAMWASLLNPKGKGTRSAATGWMPAPGAGEVADEEPAKAADAVEGAEVDDTAADGARVGQTYWGNNGN